MGMMRSNEGRLPGSSFMQMRISLDMCVDISGGTVTRSPSKATCVEQHMNNNEWYSKVCKLLWDEAGKGIRELGPLT